MKTIFFIYVLWHAVAIGEELQAKKDTTNVKYGWRGFIAGSVAPLVGLEYCYYGFDKFGVKWPDNAEFTSFNQTLRRGALSSYLGFYCYGIRLIGYIDWTPLIRIDNNEKEVWSKKVFTEFDTLEAGKANYYHQSYGFDFSYPMAMSKYMQLVPIVGWHRWKMVSQFEVINNKDKKVLRYFSESRDYKNLTLELQLMFFHLWGEKSKTLPYYTRQKGVYVKPSYKTFIENDFRLINLEVGIGSFIKVPSNSYLVHSIYFNLGVYQGNLRSTMYKVGWKIM
jgi:hypothetical protein